MKEIKTIEYTEPIYEQVTEGTGTYSRRIGERRMRCQVQVDIHVESIVNQMGKRACLSKSGKCVDGHVVVKRLGLPVEVKDGAA